MDEPIAPSAAPGSALARRLRELRIAGFPDVKLTQRQLRRLSPKTNPARTRRLVFYPGERPGAYTAAAQPPQRLRAVLRHGALTDRQENPAWCRAMS